MLNFNKLFFYPHENNTVGIMYSIISFTQCISSFLLLNEVPNINGVSEVILISIIYQVIAVICLCLLIKKQKGKENILYSKPLTFTELLKNPIHRIMMLKFLYKFRLEKLYIYIIFRMLFIEDTLKYTEIATRCDRNIYVYFSKKILKRYFDKSGSVKLPLKVETLNYYMTENLTNSPNMFDLALNEVEDYILQNYFNSYKNSKEYEEVDDIFLWISIITTRLEYQIPIQQFMSKMINELTYEHKMRLRNPILWMFYQKTTESFNFSLDDTSNSKNNSASLPGGSSKINSAAKKSPSGMKKSLD